jgi:hypothetical protein
MCTRSVCCTPAGGRWQGQRLRQRAATCCVQGTPQLARARRPHQPPHTASTSAAASRATRTTTRTTGRRHQRQPPTQARHVLLCGEHKAEVGPGGLDVHVVGAAQQQQRQLERSRNVLYRLHLRGGAAADGEGQWVRRRVRRAGVAAQRWLGSDACVAPGAGAAAGRLEGGLCSGVLAGGRGTCGCRLPRSPAGAGRGRAPCSARSPFLAWPHAWPQRAPPGSRGRP